MAAKRRPSPTPQDNLVKQSESRWLFLGADAMGVFESVLFVPLNLFMPRLGQGRGVWSTPLVVAFFAAFAAVLFCVVGTEKHLVRDRGARWSDALPLGGPVVMVIAGMGGMLLTALGVAPLLLGILGAVAEGAGSACCLVGSMGYLKSLRPNTAANMLEMALAFATVILLVAGSTSSPWFIVGHMALVALAWPLWKVTLQNTPELARVEGPTSEVWGQYDRKNTWTAVAQFSSYALYGFLLVVAGDIRLSEEGHILMFRNAPEAVLAGGAVIYVVALAALMLFYGRRRAISVTRGTRMILAIMGASAFCMAYIPMLSAIAQCLVLSALVFWDQIFLLMALPIMRSDVCSIGEAVCLPNAFLALAVVLATLFARILLLAVGVPVALFGATVVVMLVLSCCIHQTEPNFASSRQTGPQFLDELPPQDAVRFAPAIMRYGFTAREAELLPLLADGLSAAAMAERLCISVPTVNSHVQHIYAKAGVHGRKELLAKLESHK